MCPLFVGHLSIFSRRERYSQSSLILERRPLVVIYLVVAGVHSGSTLN